MSFFFVNIGAFVAAPVGGMLFAIGGLILRVSYQFIVAKRTGKPFTAFDRPSDASGTVTDGDESVIAVPDSDLRSNDEEGAKIPLKR